MRNLRNVARWIPIIWDDRDWDYHYLLTVLYHKIRFMHQSMPDWLRMDAGEVSVEMSRAMYLLENILDNKHEEGAYTLHTHLHGRSAWEFHDIDDRENFKRLEITYPDAESDELATEDLMRLSRAAHERHSADLKELFELLKGLERWWD